MHCETHVHYGYLNLYLSESDEQNNCSLYLNCIFHQAYSIISQQTCFHARAGIAQVQLIGRMYNGRVAFMLVSFIDYSGAFPAMRSQMTS